MTLRERRRIHLLEVGVARPRKKADATVALCAGGGGASISSACPLLLAHKKSTRNLVKHMNRLRTEKEAHSPTGGATSERSQAKDFT